MDSVKDHRGVTEPGPPDAERASEVVGDASTAVFLVDPKDVESSVHPVASPVVWMLDTGIGIAAGGIQTVRKGVLFFAPGVRRAGALVPAPAFLQRYADRGVAERQAVTALVASIVPQVVDRVLDQIDINQLIRERVDIGEIAESIDVAEIVERMDLASKVEDIIDAMDLPAIVRESSGALASETVRAVRYRTVAADDRINSAMNRLFRRRAQVQPADAQGEAT